MTVTTSSRDRHAMLDAMRAGAALLVCAGHLRAATMVELRELDAPGIAVQLFYLLTGLGHQAVMVFFVLSGYLVGGSVVAAGRQFQWRPYAVARLSRLWTVLLPCLAMTWAVDQAVLHIAPQVLDGSHAARWHSGPQPGQYDASWSAWLGNVCFLQTWQMPVFGSNGPLWSLANEFWYYLSFPLLAQALGRWPSVGWHRAISAGLFLGLMGWMPRDMAQGFVVWLMGVGVFLVQETTATRLPGTFRLLTALALPAAIVFSKWAGPRAWSSPWADWLLGLGVSAFLLAQLRGHGRGTSPAWFQAAIGRLSDISFSLYLSHFPWIVLVAAAGYLDRPMRPSGPSLLAYGAWLVALVAIAHGLWWLFERNTPAVRRVMGWRWSNMALEG